MTWYLHASSHYLSQCWPGSLPTYCGTAPEWVKYLWLNKMDILMTIFYRIFIADNFHICFNLKLNSVYIYGLNLHKSAMIQSVAWYLTDGGASFEPMNTQFSDTLSWSITELNIQWCLFRCHSTKGCVAGEIQESPLRQWCWMEFHPASIIAA